jgi:uncharacterized membrane protein SpoIIM required for sporulation
MNQQNIQLKNLSSNRITGLREFVGSGITDEHIAYYGKMQKFYQLEDAHKLEMAKGKLAISNYYVSVGLLIVGILFLIPCFVFLFLYPSIWAGLIVTVFGLIEGAFFWGYHRNSKYFYPLPEDLVKK